MVRAGEHGVAAESFWELALVGIGWYGVDWTVYKDLASIRSKLKDLAPHKTGGQHVAASRQIYKFLHEVRRGDGAVTYHPAKRHFLLGTIDGPAVFAPTMLKLLPTVRPVIWHGVIPKESVSRSSLNLLGAIMTLYIVSESAEHELRTLYQPRD